MINIILKSINNLPLSVIAILFMIVSGMFAASMHCLIRVAALESHPFQIAFFRTLFVLIIFLPVVMKDGLISLKVVDKKLWAKEFNIGYEVRGNTRKQKRKTKLLKVIVLLKFYL